MLMQKGGVSMYTTKEKKNVSLYQGYSPRFPMHQKTEIEVYIAHSVGKSISKDMNSVVRCISNMVIHGLTTKGQ